jgi:hypothetical protein
MSEVLPPIEPKKDNKKTILMVVAGVFVLCCLCCGLLLLGQYILENSDLTLVYIFQRFG